MATIAVAKASAQDPDHLYLWEALVTGSLDGEAIEIPGRADMCVQVVGTFDTATLTMQGSNDGTNWAPLTDPADADIAMTVTGISQIMEKTKFVRPLVSSVGATTDLDVFLFVRATGR